MKRNRAECSQDRLDKEVGICSIISFAGDAEIAFGLLPDRRERPERLKRPDRRDKLEKLNRPDKQDRPDRRNSLEIFRKFYRIGREKLMNSKARLIEISLPQPIPQNAE